MHIVIGRAIIRGSVGVVSRYRYLKSTPLGIKHLAGTSCRPVYTAVTMTSTTYNWLGSSGLKVSNICLGTMTFGQDSRGRPSCTKELSHAILDRYVQLGGNFIDTADVYCGGRSEEIIGEWLVKQPRHKLVVATKFGRNMDSADPNCIGGSRGHIMNSIESSLKRLQTDYVDMYYLHLWDDGVPIEETLSAMNDLVRMGKVRYLGMSNLKGWQLQKVVDISKHRGYQPIVSLQNQYSLLCRSPEFEVTEVCQNEGVGFLPWSPLKGGWLSGKVTQESDAAAQGTRMAWAGAGEGRAIHSHPNRDWFGENKQIWQVIGAAGDIAKTHGRSVAQVALRWLLQKQLVPSVVIGVRTMEQFEDNMAASSGWELSVEEMKTLDEASAIPWPYPYDYLRSDNKDRVRK